MQDYISIITHSNYKHWRYSIEHGLSLKKEMKNVTFLDLRGYAKNDKFAYIMQLLESFFYRNAVRQSKKYLKKNGVSIVRIKLKITDRIRIKTRANHLSKTPISDIQEMELRNGFKNHFSTEIGYLQIDFDEIDMRNRKTFFMDFLTGEKLGIEIMKRYKPFSCSFSHGRLPIQLGLIKVLNDTKISFVGLSGGGDENKYSVIPQGVHNMPFWRDQFMKEINDITLQEKVPVNFETFHRRENEYIRNMDNNLIDFLQIPYVVFYTGSDGEDAFILPFEEGEFFEGELSALDSFYQEALNIGKTPVIRMHPKGFSKQWTEFKENREKHILNSFPKAVIFTRESTVNSYSLGKGADLIASYHSTIGIELAMQGVPMIFFGPTIYRELLSSNFVKNSHEMNKALLMPPKANTEVFYKWAKWEGMYGEKFIHYKIFQELTEFNGEQVFEGYKIFSHFKNNSKLRRFLIKNYVLIQKYANNKR